MNPALSIFVWEIFASVKFNGDFHASDGESSLIVKSIPEKIIFLFEVKMSFANLK